MTAIKSPALAALCALALLAGCQRSSPPQPAPTATAPSRVEAEPQKGDVEACVDAWLKAQRLDPYGNPEGTVYAGGTPLFDERTGEVRDRLDYVFSRQPLARALCAPDTAAKGADAGLPTE